MPIFTKNNFFEFTELDLSRFKTEFE